MSYAPQHERFRTWLRKHTPYNNSEEFFIMLVMDKGVPPHPITDKFVSVNWKLSSAYPTDLWKWRGEVATRLNRLLPVGIDPSTVMREYLKWLREKQKSSRLSRP